MGDFAVEGSELKKMIKTAKKQPVAFGFNPGKSEEDAYCGMHRNKPATQLGKDAKDAAEGGKYAFGTATVTGKTINLTCLRELPGLAKRFKKYLKTQKVMLNVVILDADGNVLESDIEDDLPDDPELEGDAAESESDAEEADEAGTEAPTLGDDRTALIKRLSAMRDRILALPPEAQAKLAGPFRQLTDFVKAKLGTPLFEAKDLEQATANADKLDAAIALLAGAAASVPQQAADPQMQKLQQVAASTRAKVGEVADEKPRTQLLAAMDRVDGHIKAAEVEAAVGLLKKVNDILKTQPQAGEGETTSGETADPAQAEWEKRFGALESTINEALTQGLVEKVDDLRKLRDWATGMAIDKQFAKALQALPRIEAILASATVDGKSAFEADIDPAVKPFAMARLRWTGARSTIMSEVKRLEADIVAAAAENELLEKAAAEVSTLTRSVEKLDDRLETKLDNVVNAKTGPDRERLKGEARAVIGEYEAELGKPFFADIDNNNGFISIAVASTARAALADIARVLA